MIDQEVVNAGVEVAKLLAKGLLSSAALAALSWGTIEWLLPAFVGVRAEKCPTCGRSGTEGTKRAIAFAMGFVVTFLAHGADVVSFGAGPRGWMAAALFAFLGGGLAPALHTFIQKRLPILANPANGAPPAAPA